MLLLGQHNNNLGLPWRVWGGGKHNQFKLGPLLPPPPPPPPPTCLAAVHPRLEALYNQKFN